MHTSVRQLARVTLLAAAFGAIPVLASCDSTTAIADMAKNVGLDPAQLTSKLGSYSGKLNGLNGSMNDLLANAATDPKGAIDKFSAAAKSFGGENNALSSAMSKLTEGGNTDMLKSWLGGAGKKATPEQLNAIAGNMKQFGAESGKVQSMLNDVTGKLLKNPTADGISGAKSALSELGNAKSGLSKVTDSLTSQLKGLMG